MGPWRINRRSFDSLRSLRMTARTDNDEEQATATATTEILAFDFAQARMTTVGNDGGAVRQNDDGGGMTAWGSGLIGW